MAKKRGSAEKKTQKTFVWKSLRVGFWLMVGLWLISSILELYSGNFYSNSVFATILSLLFFVSIIFTFVISIIHLNKHREKGLAVTALVISSILVLLIVVGIITAFTSSPLPIE